MELDSIKNYICGKYDDINSSLHIDDDIINTCIPGLGEHPVSDTLKFFLISIAFSVIAPLWVDGVLIYFICGMFFGGTALLLMSRRSIAKELRKQLKVDE